MKFISFIFFSKYTLKNDLLQQLFGQFLYDSECVHSILIVLKWKIHRDNEQFSQVECGKMRMKCKIFFSDWLRMMFDFMLLASITPTIQSSFFALLPFMYYY